MARRVRYPGDTAESVRWAYKEYEYEKTSLFSDAIAEVKTVIQQRKKLCDSKALSRNKRKPGGPTFDDLPYDIKDIIFDMIRSSPGWVHFEIRNGKLVGFNGGNREIYVNREWYHSTTLRKGLSCNQNLDLRLLGGSLSPAEKKKRENWGDKVFQCEFKPWKTHCVRRRVDWFFFDGNANVDSSYPYLHEIRTCVVRLGDIFDGIPSDEEHTTGDGLSPKFIWEAHSQLEELVILVGEYRKDVQPEEMIEIGAFRIDDDIPYEDEGDGFLLKMDRLLMPNSKNLNIHHSDEWMMALVSKHLAFREVQRRMHRWDFLDTEEGKELLTNGPPTWWNLFSAWIMNPDGDKWLRTKGLEFLRSESGHWWLSSKYGYPWLETGGGIRWLGTEDAKKFLESGWALLWARTGLYRPKTVPELGRQVRKAWFDTPAGREWKGDHCPNGNPPMRPEPEPEFKPRPHGVIRYPISGFHRNFRFRGWRFVISPEDLARGPKGRVVEPGRKIGHLRHPLSALLLPLG
ncbi:subunit of the Arp2/3 complex [Hypoxylon texense]